MLQSALVLAAGLGTRLRPLTDVRAKPAIPVAGEPMIRRIASWLAASGVPDVVVNLHHRPETLTGVLGDGADLGVRVRYSWEQPIVLGSAGGPRYALPLLDGDPFFVVNGDTLTDLDLAVLVEAHARSGALVTLALVPNREHGRYGGVQLDRGGRVTAFVRRGPGARGSYHFIGAQVAAAAAFARVEPGRAASSIGGIYDELLHERPGAVHGVVCDAGFWDVGTPADYWRTSHAFAGSAGGVRNAIDPSARIIDSILWDDVTIEADAAVSECILTDGVTVRAGAVHRRAILTRGADGVPAVTPLDI